MVDADVRIYPNGILPTMMYPCDLRYSLTALIRSEVRSDSAWAILNIMLTLNTPADVSVS